MPSARSVSHALTWCSALALFIIMLIAISGEARAAESLKGEPAPAPQSVMVMREGPAYLPLPENPEPAQMASPTPTREPRRPTRTPGPTNTPIPIPPPQDPGVTQMMVAFGILVVLVILFGVWLNRKNAG